MKAGINPHIPESSNTSSKKGKGLVFFLCLFGSLFVHAVVVMAVVYGVNGIGREPRVITLDVSFVREEIQSNKEQKLSKTKTTAPIKNSNKKIASLDKKNTKNIKTNKNTSKGQSPSAILPILKNIRTKVQVPPKYPFLAKRRGYEGTVLVHALVEKTGHIKTTKIVSSSGYGSLDSAAVTAVEQWEFEIDNSNNVKAWVEVPVQFILSERK